MKAVQCSAIQMTHSDLRVVRPESERGMCRRRGWLPAFCERSTVDRWGIRMIESLATSPAVPCFTKTIMCSTCRKLSRMVTCSRWESGARKGCHCWNIKLLIPHATPTDNSVRCLQLLQFLELPNGGKDGAGEVVAQGVTQAQSGTWQHRMAKSNMLHARPVHASVPAIHTI